MEMRTPITAEVPRIPRGLLEAVSEIVLHSHITRFGGHIMQLRSKEQYADRSRKRHEDLLPDARPACCIAEASHTKNCHSAADAGHHKQSKSPEAKVSSGDQEILRALDLFGGQGTDSNQ